MDTTQTSVAFMEKHLSVVKFYKDGKFLVGASALNGRFWTGSLWCFSNVDDAPDMEKSIASMSTVCGFNDILCLSDGNIIIGRDSGALEVCSIEDVPTPPHFHSAFMSVEHEDIISSLSLNSDESRFASSSYDKSIKIWDTQACATVATFKPIHAAEVLQVSFSTTDPNVLLSCGLDGLLLLLDLRLPKPATIIESDCTEQKPTAVSWKPQSNTMFAVGKQNGNIVVQDIRMVDNKLLFQGHNRAIHRLAFSNSKPSLLASCADETKVLVTDVDISSPKTIYSNEEHEDFVRGLLWDANNNLVTCGFDSKVLQHKIEEPSDTIANGI